jgi:hypothetical protein
MGSNSKLKFFKKQYWLLISFLLLFAGALFLVYRLSNSSGQKGECQRETISRAISQDSFWIAYVYEDIRSDGYFTTVVADTVHLVRAHKHQLEGDVFTIDTGGDPTNRPILKWLSSRLLQIEVPNKSLIGLHKRRFDDVIIRVKFNPNDPAQRKRWLKEIEKGSSFGR